MKEQFDSEAPLRPLPYGLLKRMADVAISPLRLLAAGGRAYDINHSSPWSCHEVDPDAVDPEKVLIMPGVKGQKPVDKRTPRFQMPVAGGWNEYGVLQPRFEGSGDELDKLLFYIGWVSVAGKAELNDRPIEGAVRVLRGPDPTAFFAVNGLGQQLRLKCIGAGRLGPNGLNRYVASWAQLY